ncbi:MAG: DNA polymerase III subunit alpha [Myxococcales bacterium FL481]|nr:MAG: DNA polymerase III subunit alpha [Myxococcales bacterium FL481]
MATDNTGDLAGVSDFAHLHLHTQYSLLDGAIRTRDLCKTVRERGMKSVAVTDHGNMFGALQFYKEAKEQGVKPIFGCEAYLSDGDCEAKTDRKNYHIVLLAKNDVGYRNLQRLVSFGHLRGFYYNPRVDRKLLRQHREGIIATSACLGGHVSRLVTSGDMDQAREVVREYRDIFEPGQYFLELQPNGMAAQEKVNEALAELGRDLDVPLVATNDCHYVNRDQAHAHEILMCMGMGRTFDDPKRLRHECDEFFIKRPDEMVDYFRRYPTAFENAGRIASMCNVELSLGRPELPDFELPPGVQEDLPGYLRKIAYEGLNQRFDEIRRMGAEPNVDAYRARLEHELGIIIDMKFPGYFLIVWDFIREAKVMGVPVGPGRGSGAGSLVAYALRITDLDPITYNLLFERFLNPDRVSMPDFDIDFCMDRREEVIRYVTDRYGHDRVGQIATFHTLKARGLVRDVARVLGVPVSDATDIAKRVPEGPKVTLSMAMTDPEPLKKKAKKDPALAKRYKDVIEVADAAQMLRQRAEIDEKAREILTIGCSLEGLNRHAGMHAAGIVIGNRELWEHVPCFQADNKIVTQYTMTDVEQAGLVKFDFLGLKTLTVIDVAERLVNSVRRDDEPLLDVASVRLDDAAVYEMISRGDTTGVFQLESTGFKKLLTKLRPDCFEDIIAAVALYRPGPLEGGMVDQFIECKHGRREIEYPHEALQPVLEETYGVFVYQEQVMQAAQILAGFSLGAADLMRRAMGKKKKAEMDRQRALFVEGCANVSQMDADKANEIFDLIDKFAGYGFNKSHSAAYGLITYRTAYLKCRHSVAFMAALMTCDKDKIENVVKFIAEARAMSIEVLPPSVNDSDADFGLVVGEGGRQGIRFGLGAVRNVGGNAVDAVVEARKDGPYASVFELARRVDLKKVNRRTLEGLVTSGAMDPISAGHSRAQLLATLPSAIDQAQGAQRDRNTGQTSLFGALESPAAAYVEAYADCEEWTPKQALAAERDALGFYLTGHPLDRYVADIERHATATTAALTPKLAGSVVVLGGVLCEMREVQTKSGKGPMAFFQVEDQFGRIEGIVFPKTYARVVDEDRGTTFREVLAQCAEEPLLVTGKLEVDVNEEGEVSRYKLLVDNVQPLAGVREDTAKAVLVRCPVQGIDDDKIAALAKVVTANRGPCPLEIQLAVDGRFTTEIALGDDCRVAATDELVFALERLFGSGAVSLT